MSAKEPRTIVHNAWNETCLEQFDPSELPKNASLLIVGPRESGKTVLTRDLLKHLEVEREFVFCGSNPDDIPDVYLGYDPEVLGMIINEHRDAAIVFTDCTQVALKCTRVRELLKYRNNRKQAVIAEVQQFPCPRCLDHFDYIMLPYNLGEEARELFRAAYVKAMEPEVFSSILDSLKPYDFLVVQGARNASMTVYRAMLPEQRRQKYSDFS